MITPTNNRIDMNNNNNRDYKIVSDENQEYMELDTSVLFILKEPYVGVTFRYKQISIDEDPETDKAVIHYEYEVLGAQEGFDLESLQNGDPDFELFIGDMLINIISERLDESQHLSDATDDSYFGLEEVSE